MKRWRRTSGSSFHSQLIHTITPTLLICQIASCWCCVCNGLVLPLLPLRSHVVVGGPSGRHHALTILSATFRMDDEEEQEEANGSDDEQLVENADESLLMEAEELQRLTCKKTTATSSLEVPSVMQILKFAIPAIGIWLCSPLLSLIDTSTVGLLCGTSQQAALNPAVGVTDYSARTMSFLYTGTTNMVAVAQASSRDDPDNNTATNNKHHEATARTFAGALQLSLWVGLGLASTLLLSAHYLVGWLIGGKHAAASVEVMEAAIRYVQIRALSMPAAAFLGTAQAACLGLKDVKSPLYVILVAAGLNLILDVALVGNPHRWIGGAAGAAWATTISQYVAASLFWKWLTTTTDKKGNKSPRRRSSFSARGYLARYRTVSMVSQRPPQATIDGFQPYILPVTTTQVGRCSPYIAMGHVISSSFGTINMAANQVVNSIFYALIPIADSLSLTAQSLLPAIVASPDSSERTAALRKTSFRLLQVAGIFGLVLARLVAWIPRVLHLFTNDPQVMVLVKKMVPMLMAIFSLHGVFCGSEGILLAQRDLTYLGRMYALYCAVVPIIMLRLKKGSSGGDLTSVWKIFLAYHLFRISAWVGRVIWLQRPTRSRHDHPEELSA